VSFHYSASGPIEHTLLPWLIIAHARRGCEW
jgi:hypothetical protein